jgi:hypothetical protein
MERPIGEELKPPLQLDPDLGSNPPVAVKSSESAVATNSLTANS